MAPIPNSLQIPDAALALPIYSSIFSWKRGGSGSDITNAGSSSVKNVTRSEADSGISACPTMWSSVRLPESEPIEVEFSDCGNPMNNTILPFPPIDELFVQVGETLKQAYERATKTTLPEGSRLKATVTSEEEVQALKEFAPFEDGIIVDVVHAMTPTSTPSPTPRPSWPDSASSSPSRGDKIIIGLMIGFLAIPIGTLTGLIVVGLPLSYVLQKRDQRRLEAATRRDGREGTELRERSGEPARREGNGSDATGVPDNTDTESAVDGYSSQAPVQPREFV